MIATGVPHTWSSPILSPWAAPDRRSRTDEPQSNRYAHDDDPTQQNADPLLRSPKHVVQPSRLLFSGIYQQFSMRSEIDAAYVFAIRARPIMATPSHADIPPARWQARRAALRARGVPDDEPRVGECLLALAHWRVRLLYRFLSALSGISAHFRPRRHRLRRIVEGHLHWRQVRRGRLSSGMRPRWYKSSSKIRPKV